MFAVGEAEEGKIYHKQYNFHVLSWDKKSVLSYNSSKSTLEYAEKFPLNFERTKRFLSSFQSIFSLSISIQNQVRGEEDQLKSI